MHNIHLIIPVADIDNIAATFDAVTSSIRLIAKSKEFAVFILSCDSADMSALSLKYGADNVWMRTLLPTAEVPK